MPTRSPHGKDPSSRRGDRHKIRAKSVRIEDELWDAFRRKVADEGKTITAVLAVLIRRYLRE